jgi:hypothetical protein
MPYIANGLGYTYGLKTLSQIDSITGMVDGETVYCSDYNKIFTWDDYWMCSDFIVVTNSAGATLDRWDVVIGATGGTASVPACATTTTAGNGKVLGVIVFGGVDTATVVIAVKGNWRANCDEAMTTGNDITTSTTAGEGQFNAGSYSAGVFALATETTGGAGACNCIIMPRKELY